MLERVAWFTDHHKLIEAQRIQQRTQYDMEMLEEIGFAAALRTIPVFSPADRRGVCRTLCWITSRKTFS